jgi:hypothetical protein
MDYDKRQSNYSSKKVYCSEFKILRSYNLWWDPHKNTWGKDTCIVQLPIINIIIIIIITTIIENIDVSTLQCLKI